MSEVKVGTKVRIKIPNREYALKGEVYIIDEAFELCRKPEGGAMDLDGEYWRKVEGATPYCIGDRGCFTVLKDQTVEASTDRVPWAR